MLDLASRYKKALKIDRLLELSGENQPICLLEVGTGSGGIAQYFTDHEIMDFKVTAVDVVDQRLLRDKYDFVLVQDTHLPFADQSFDVVISNHVIDHVGDRHAQSHHLSEIYRVLKKNGVGYFSVFNRWMIVEPHYQLMFLSWLPRNFRTRYLQLRKRGDFYDCEPLTKRELETLFKDNKLVYRNICTRALRETLSIEKNHGKITAFIGKLPYPILDWLSALSPTLIYKLRR